MPVPSASPPSRTRRRTAAPGLLALALAAALSGCAGTAPAAAPASTSPGGSGASGPSGSSAPPSASPSAAVRRLSITVSGPTITGDTGLVKIPVGQPVRLTVHSDVADEVHVHGADVHADVTAGGTVSLDFTQDAPGRFEIELEGAKRRLALLQVS